MDPTSFNLFAGSSYSSGSSLQSGNWYPMFAVKLFNANGQLVPSANAEYGMRNALQFNTSPTSELDGTESLTQIINVLDAFKYTCNPAFKTSTTYISGFQIKHYQNASTLYDECEATWNGTGFNIYDHACSVQSNLSFALPSQVGTIQTATINSTNILQSNSFPVYINCSSRSSRSGSLNWASDGGDYVFMGVTDRTHSVVNSDTLDSGWSSQIGLAFGLSDSDGTPTSGQSPMLGISRRASYPSLCTNWQERSNSGHGGRTTYGYFIVYGKVI